jgi:cell division protein FtsI (penicillin-binding protein 3)
VYQGEKWTKQAEEYGLQFQKVKAARGNILSEDGELLAGSLPFFQLAIDPTFASDSIFYQNIDTLAFLLSQYFKEKMPSQIVQEIKEAREQKRKYLLLSRKFLNYHEKEDLLEWPFVNLGRLKSGIIFVKTEKRFWPYEPLARRTIGFVNEDSTGEFIGRGLEYSFNQVLAGKEGEALFRRGIGGRWFPVNDGNFVKPENGKDIQTTFDIELQDYATKLLEKNLQNSQANYGCIIVMEVATGHLKAVVNLGKHKDKYVENRNYAFGAEGLCEPGSTFKLVSMMALMEEAGTRLTDTVNTYTGKYEFYEDCIMNDAVPTGYGNLTVKQVFEKSSNIGVSRMMYATFAQKPKKYLEYLSRFKLNEPLGTQFYGMGKPSIKTPESKFWSGCSIPWMSIGYEIQITPLHLLTFYNAVANEGKMIEPILVDKILEGNRVIKNVQAKTLNAKICSDKTLENLKSMLEGVVESGTARSIKTPKYKIAGKTGTAQKVKNGAYTKEYFSSFVGYFPAESPKYSIIVVVDEPKGEFRFGGDVAAPIFRQISDRIFLKKISKPIKVKESAQNSLPEVVVGNTEDLELVMRKLSVDYSKASAGDWSRAIPQNGRIELNDAYTREGIMPNLRGLNLRDALFILENQGVKVKSYGAGVVKSQSIRPGNPIAKGSFVFLSLE